MQDLMFNDDFMWFFCVLVKLFTYRVPFVMAYLQLWRGNKETNCNNCNAYFTGIIFG